MTLRSLQVAGETPVAAAKARERYSRVEKPTWQNTSDGLGAWSAQAHGFWYNILPHDGHKMLTILNVP